MSYSSLYKHYKKMTGKKNSKNRSFNRKQQQFEMQTFNEEGFPTALLRKLNRSTSRRSHGGTKKRGKKEYKKYIL